jgi:hypothetical protein
MTIQKMTYEELEDEFFDLKRESDERLQMEMPVPPEIESILDLLEAEISLRDMLLGSGVDLGGETE